MSSLPPTGKDKLKIAVQSLPFLGRPSPGPRMSHAALVLLQSHVQTNSIQYLLPDEPVESNSSAKDQANELNNLAPDEPTIPLSAIFPKQTSYLGRSSAAYQLSMAARETSQPTLLRQEVGSG
jgi:hypothetical protein